MAQAAVLFHENCNLRMVRFFNHEFDKSYLEKQRSYKVVSETVINPEGKPLAGTSIVIRGTTTGTIADENGNFKLTVVSKEGGTGIFLRRISNSSNKGRW